LQVSLADWQVPFAHSLLATHAVPAGFTQTPLGHVPTAHAVLPLPLQALHAPLTQLFVAH
jgi:hypothetical protein